MSRAGTLAVVVCRKGAQGLCHWLNSMLPSVSRVRENTCRAPRCVCSLTSYCEGSSLSAPLIDPPSQRENTAPAKGKPSMFSRGQAKSRSARPRRDTEDGTRATRAPCWLSDRRRGEMQADPNRHDTSAAAGLRNRSIWLGRGGWTEPSRSLTFAAFSNRFAELSLDTNPGWGYSFIRWALADPCLG